MTSSMVEIVGVEPTTLCLQSRCSSQLSYTPVFSFLLSDNCVRLLILPPHNHKVAASVGARLPCSHLKINFKILSIFGVGLRIGGRSFTEVNSLPSRLSALNPLQNFNIRF